MSGHSTSTAATEFAQADLGWHDVTEYGAVGDGETDNRDAIQDAVDDAGAVPGVVYVPPSDDAYAVDGSIELGEDHRGTSIVGGGYGSVVEQIGTDTGVDLFSIESTADVIVRDLRCEGAARENVDVAGSERVTVARVWSGHAGRGDPSGDGIDFDDCTDCVVHRAYTYDNAGGGVHVSSGSTRVLVSQCVSRNDRTATGEVFLPSIDIYEASRSSIQQCLSIDSGDGGFGIDERNAEGSSTPGRSDGRNRAGNSIANSVSVGADGNGIHVRGGSGALVTSCTTIDSGRYGIRAQTDDSGRIPTVVSDCIDVGSRGDGIHAIGADVCGCIVANAELEDIDELASQAGIRFRGHGDVRCTGCRVVDTQHGVHVAGEVDSARVTNATFEAVPGEDYRVRNKLTVINGVASGEGDGETPPASSFQPGDTVEWTDTRSNETGLFVLLADGQRWMQVG